MRRLCLKLSAFGLGFVGLMLIGLMLPTPSRIEESMVFAKEQKDSLLRNVPGPRVIFVGGSNTSYGINSQLLKDSLGLNPVNTGVSFNLGLYYIMASITHHVHPNDIVILAPEYQHFFGDFAFGRKFLLYSTFDVDGRYPWDLTGAQWRNLYAYIPEFALSRFKPTQYLGHEVHPLKSAQSYNEYGDLYVHWDMPKQAVAPFRHMSRTPFNPEVIESIARFKKQVEKRGGHFFVTFPGMQRTSYENCEEQVEMIHAALREAEFTLLGTPQDYLLPDSLMFNFPYHPVKEGVDLRTHRLIEDLTQGLAELEEKGEAVHYVGQHDAADWPRPAATE